MSKSDLIKLLAVFVVILVVSLSGTATLAVVGGGDTADGAAIDGQSPSQFQPDAVNPAVDPEDGDISVEDGDATILVDRRHENDISRSELEPVVTATFGAGHSIEFTDTIGSLDQALDDADGYLVVRPSTGFSETERDAIEEFTDDGGRVVILAEPTQPRAASGPFGAPTTVSFAAEDLTADYGVRLGPEVLYNNADEANDNNFKSIYATPAESGPLTEGVDTVTFDTGGYAVVRDDDAEVLVTAADGTRTLDTRRTGTYPTVVRNGNVVVVTDASFIERSELYDADNEVFVGNLIDFLAGSGAGDGGDGTADSGSTATETNSTDSGGNSTSSIAPQPGR